LARIAGVDIPKNKRLEVALTYIFGIGRTSAATILKNTKISPDTRVKDLTEEEVGILKNYIEANFVVEGELRKIVQLNIKRLIDMRSYRGLRHRMGLPVRGQRTKTNARTRKGPKRIAVKGKAKVKKG